MRLRRLPIRLTHGCRCAHGREWLPVLCCACLDKAREMQGEGSLHAWRRCWGVPGGDVEGQAPDVVQVCVRQAHCLLVHTPLGAAPGVEDQPQLRQDDARLLRASIPPGSLQGHFQGILMHLHPAYGTRMSLHQGPDEEGDRTWPATEMLPGSMM